MYLIQIDWAPKWGANNFEFGSALLICMNAHTLSFLYTIWMYTISNTLNPSPTKIEEEWKWNECYAAILAVRSFMIVVSLVNITFSLQQFQLFPENIRLSFAPRLDEHENEFHAELKLQQNIFFPFEWNELKYETIVLLSWLQTSETLFLSSLEIRNFETRDKHDKRMLLAARISHW